MNTARILAGVALVTVGCVAVAQAQGSASLPIPDLLNSAGFLAGGGALIAWGTQKEKVRAHENRLTALEDDRVTRLEFLGMDERLGRIQDDMRSMRETSESRMLQLLDMLERRSVREG